MDVRFQLENFSGPLDLLLYLVQREEVDIRDISLVRICDQYVDVLEAAEDKDIERAGEFFVLAATLMLVKARSLLPSEEVDLAAELDPEAELLQQLLEYRQFKEASRTLDRQARGRETIHPSRPAVTDAGIPLEEVDLLDLVEAFRQVLRDTGLDSSGDGSTSITADRPVSSYIQDMLDLLHQTPSLSFFEVFAGSRTRTDLIGFFLATLELIKFRVLRVRQDRPFADIVVEAVGELPDSLTSITQQLTSDRAPPLVIDDGEGHEVNDDVVGTDAEGSGEEATRTEPPAHADEVDSADDAGLDEHAPAG